MSAEHRTHPPGKGRIAAASKAGLFAKSEMLVAGLVLLACSGMMAVMGENLRSELSSLSLEGALRSIISRPDPIEALKDGLAKGVWILTPILGAAFLAGCVGTILPAVVSRRGKGRTAVPLPGVQKIRAASLVLKTAGVLLLLLVSLQVIRSHRGALTDVMFGNTNKGNELFDGFTGLLASGGVIMILVGMAEQALKRHSLWQSLHLSSSEAKRENRATGGDRTMASQSIRRARKEAVK